MKHASIVCSPNGTADVTLRNSILGGAKGVPFSYEVRLSAIRKALKELPKFCSELRLDLVVHERLLVEGKHREESLRRGSKDKIQLWKVVIDSACFYTDVKPRGTMEGAVITKVRMSRKEYNALPEFEGP